MRGYAISRDHQLFEFTAEQIEHMNLKAIKINTVVAVMSIITSITLCAVFIFNSGSWKAEITTKLQTQESQMTELMTKGSPALIAHVQMDTKDTENLKQDIKLFREDVQRRFEMNEKRVEAINTFQVTVAVLNSKLENLDSKIDSFKRVFEEQSKLINDAAAKIKPSP